MEQSEFQRLGRKTLTLFVLKRSGIGLLLLVLSIVLLIAGASVAAVVTGGRIAFLVALVVLLVAVGIGWLEYARYKISLRSDSIQISRGVLEEEEIGVPYRHIEDVAIHRSLLDQIIGVSNLTLSITSSDKDLTDQVGAKVIVPSIDRKLAEDIQQELMSRANIEDIKVDSSRPPAASPL